MKVKYCDICNMPLKNPTEIKEKEYEDSYQKIEKQWAGCSPLFDFIIEPSFGGSNIDICLVCKKEIITIFKKWMKKRKEITSELYFKMNFK